MTDLTLDSRGEGRLRLKEGVHSCTYPWVEVLKATLLSPQRATHLMRHMMERLIRVVTSSCVKCKFGFTHISVFRGFDNKNMKHAT